MSGNKAGAFQVFHVNSRYQRMAMLAFPRLFSISKSGGPLPFDADTTWTSDYVRGYTHGVAISNHRPLDVENGQVRFQWKNYRDGGEVKTMTLPAGEFMRRFLLHVLPDGFQRIRYYGFLGNRYRREKLAQCRRLHGMPAQAEQTNVPAEQDYRDRFEQLTGLALHHCPHCQQGRMLVVEILPCLRCKSTPPMDSS
jgi:hypothetical protein